MRCAIGSAIAVVVQRNPFLAALSLILHLASLAALYLVLQGDFVAVAQLLVYAGAVMIMFLFVIAYLGDRADLDLRRGGIGAGAAGIAGLAIFIESVIAVSDSSDLLKTPAIVNDQFGSPTTIGRLFLTDHLLAFEVDLARAARRRDRRRRARRGRADPDAQRRRRPSRTSRRARAPSPSATTCAARSSAASATSWRNESEVGA